MLLAQVLARLLGEGQLTIIDAVGRPHRIEGARPGPSVTLRVHNWWTGVRVALRPRLALGEAYMDGTLTVEEGGDIYDLLDLLGRNIATASIPAPISRPAKSRWSRPSSTRNATSRPSSCSGRASACSTSARAGAAWASSSAGSSAST